MVALGRRMRDGRLEGNSVGVTVALQLGAR